MDWLEVLELIQGIGNRKWRITDSGKASLKNWILFSPEFIESSMSNDEDVLIEEAPYEIAMLLQQLVDSPDKHKKRITYNLWAPSPNRIENLRKIINYASDKVSKKDLFKFIEDEFNLKFSSAESMMPFLKAAGYIEEVGRGIYSATSASKAWIDTGNDLDFIRILHAHMRFVGEMIAFAKEDVIRNDVYSEAKKYGLNNEKARWIAGFLIEANLLEETQYLHLKATALGIAFTEQLPLADLLQFKDDEGIKQSNDSKKESNIQQSDNDNVDYLIERLKTASCDPVAFGKASGVAFEETIADIFSFMGFDAKRIGGSGDTDVIIHWKDDTEQTFTAILDGKSKSSGQVAHTDISDVAIDTHKDKHNADYVAIVGHGFSGDTIKNHAKKKRYALITADELSEIARASKKYALNLKDIALIFKVPDGLSELAELISQKQREIELISKVISKIYKEQDTLGSLSPRDLLLLLREDELSPTLEELIGVFDLLTKPEIGLLRIVNKAPAPQNVTYMIGNGKTTINRLRSLAYAIEKGLYS